MVTVEMNNMGTVLQHSLAWTLQSEITPVIEAAIAHMQLCAYVGNFSDVVISKVRIQSSMTCTTSRTEE